MICRRIEYLFKEVNGSDKADELTLKITYFFFQIQRTKAKQTNKEYIIYKMRIHNIVPGKLT